MELVTGRSGSPHITSQQDRQLHQGIFGDGAYILNTGNMLEPEVQSSNSIHILSIHDLTRRSTANTHKYREYLYKFFSILYTPPLFTYFYSSI